jgi:hypothetical protein
VAITSIPNKNLTQQTLDKIVGTASGAPDAGAPQENGFCLLFRFSEWVSGRGAVVTKFCNRIRLWSVARGA